MKHKHSTTLDPMAEEMHDVEATRTALTASLQELTDRLNPKKLLQEATANASDGAKHVLANGGRVVRINSLRGIVVATGVLAAVFGVVLRRRRRG